MMFIRKNILEESFICSNLSPMTKNDQVYHSLCLNYYLKGICYLLGCYMRYEKSLANEHLRRLPEYHLRPLNLFTLFSKLKTCVRIGLCMVRVHPTGTRKKTKLP